LATANRTLGRFHLDGIPPSPRGIPKIEVTFDIDANGILHVSAKDMGTGKQQAITITGHSGLDEKEIDRMVKEAEAHSDEDKKRREVIDAKNQADQLIYSLEKLLKESKDKIPANDAEKVKEEIENTKKAIETENVDTIRNAIEALSNASHKLTETLYQQAGPQAQPEAGQAHQSSSPHDGGGASSGGPEEEVIDAEVVDDDKKN
jgi:molecular chaperone DnaK